MKKYIVTSLTWLLCLIFITGCVNEPISGDLSSMGSNQKMVSFLVSVAGANQQKKMTRALTLQDENTVKTIEVLLFDMDGIYTVKPIYSDNITQKSNGELSFTIKVPEGTYNMVILANSRSSVNKILNNLSIGTSTKEDVLKMLVLEHSKKWEVNNVENGYQEIPMAGEMAKLVVSGDNTTVKNVSLVRMLAKVDVKLSTKAKTKFNLTDIRIYNFSVKGQIVPNKENWSSAFDKVVNPSIPVEYASIAGSYHVYDGVDIQKENNKGVASINTIYTFESPNKTDNNNLENNICLVVGGVYAEDTEPTYYKIDIANKSKDITAYLDLLRNHQYIVMIENLHGAGFTDPDLAYKSKPVNIEANVVEWSDGDIHDIIFDGQYLLGVSQSQYEFTREDRNLNNTDNNLIVTTDYPLGWKIDKIVDASGEAIDWLSTSILQGSQNKTELKILLQENFSENLRIGFINLSAGRLKHTISVEQSTNQLIDISITDIQGLDINELTFNNIDSKSADNQVFNLKWNPGSVSLSLMNIAYLGDGFIFDSTNEYDKIDSGESVLTGGEKRYNIKPVAFSLEELKENPFTVRSSFLIYTLSNDGVTINKTLALSHRALNVIPIVEPLYDLDGNQHTLFIRSNMVYTVEVKEDVDKVLTLITTSGGVNVTEKGNPILFKLKKDSNIKNTEVTLLIKSPTKQFEPKEVVINCSSVPEGVQKPANSYMVVSGGPVLRIPVARSNEWIKDAMDPSSIYKLEDGDDFNAVFIWTDNPFGMSEYGCIKSISVEGKGPSGYLVVEPGNNVGNAVVGITNKEGKILWSWHIWVSYSEHSTSVNSGELMDRNLGAITNSAKLDHIADTYGMLYQWGRKDPFVGILTMNNNTVSVAKNSFDKDGEVIELPAYSPVLVMNNLHNTIENPMYYYYSGNISINNWFSTSSEKNGNLWKVAEKTIYDPCPPGWRVPADISVWNDVLDSNTADIYWNDNFKVFDFKELGGSYPLAGFRFDTTQNIHMKGEQAVYYTSTVTEAFHPKYINGKASLIKLPGAEKTLAIAGSIRCIKE